MLMALSFGFCALAFALGAADPLPTPIIKDNSPASFEITWRNDTGIPGKFGPGVEGLRWEYIGTTRRGLDLRLSGAYVPTFNDVRVARLSSSPPYEQLAQWRFAVGDALKRGEENPARGGGVTKEPVSDGLLPGFKNVAFILRPDVDGSGWTASLKWFNP